MDSFVLAQDGTALVSHCLTKVVAAGKDLAALQRQLRPKVRATLSARATGLTRTGVTSWDFGPLPRVFTDGEVKAYPALVDAGAAVDVRLFESAAAAARSMRAGTRRLVLLAVKSPANEVAKRLTTAQKLALTDNPHGSVPALFTDCVGCAVDGLITEAGGPAWDGEGFTRIVEHVRPRLHAATYEVVTWAEEILRAAHEARMRLGTLRSPVLDPAVADIRAQLDRLIAPGFLTAAGGTRLPALARYVKAVGRRLDKLAENAGRDAQQMAVVHRVQDAYETALAALPAEARSSDAAREIRWQIEELRVSLFAQTMRTKYGNASERENLTRVRSLADNNSACEIDETPGIWDANASRANPYARSPPDIGGCTPLCQIAELKTQSELAVPIAAEERRLPVSGKAERRYEVLLSRTKIDVLED